MHEFFQKLTPELWGVLFLLANQSLSALRIKLTKNSITKDVQQIKEQVTPNGGGSMNDTVAKLVLLVQAYFTVMMNNDDKPLARADNNGSWVFCNSRLTEVFGMYHQDMLGKAWQVAIGDTISERNSFVQAWDQYHKDGSPLNHTISIINQDSKLSHKYLVTAQDIIADNKLQFHLVKFQKV